MYTATGGARSHINYKSHACTCTCNIRYVMCVVFSTCIQYILAYHQDNDTYSHINFNVPKYTFQYVNDLLKGLPVY